MTKVAIVILNWNGLPLLKKFLPIVVRYSNLANTKIIIADNGSTDTSVTYTRENFPDVEVLELCKNFGYAEGYNIALQQIEAEYFLLLNSDVEVTVGWLKPMIDHLDKNPDVAAIQPKILSYRDKKVFEYAGAAGGYLDSLGFPFCRGRIFDSVESDLGQYNSISNIFWASGACMLIRSNDFFSAGGFDPLFFAHMEEIDLCWRILNRGKQIICYPHSVVYHVGGATLKEGSPQKLYLNFRNNMLMLYKNLNRSDLKPTIQKRKKYNNLAALKYIISGKLKNAKAIFKAHKDFDVLKKQYNIDRLDNQGFNLKEVYKGNIIKDYYWSGIKRFRDLPF